MEAVRESWSDDRLDDLNRRVESGFRRVDADIRGLRSEMNARFDGMEERIDTRLESMEDRFDKRLESMEDRFDKRFDSLQRTMIWFCGSLSVSIVGLIASIVITRA